MGRKKMNRKKMTKKQKQKKKRDKYIGLGSVVPNGPRSGSIVARTATQARSFVSGGLPGLGKRR